MRLGDLDALRKQFDDIPVFIGMTGGCVQQFIDKQPTIDAVPVVRCKDCVNSDYSSEIYLWCLEHKRYVAPECFCSYGE